MTIRFAKLDDINGIVALGKAMHALTRFRTFAYDENKIAVALHFAIENKQQRHVIFIAIGSDRKIVGAILAVLEQHIFSNETIVSIMDYVVLPDYRMGGYGVRLLVALEKWAVNRKISEIAFGVNSRDGMDLVGTFARKMKYEKIGENFIKTLKL